MTPVVRPTAALFALLLALGSTGSSTANAQDTCVGFGPQTPRDIDQLDGTNPITFPIAPPAADLNLCNIHFHNGAEHRAEAFSLPVAPSAGPSGGFQCTISQTLSDEERAPFTDNACDGVNPGDTIEVHWVHTSCDVAPGPGLSSCLSDQCANPTLRVETQVFTVVNGPGDLDFTALTKLVDRAGKAQASVLPRTTGAPVEFLGSTTGPSYTDEKCSPLQVTWSVRPHCAKVDISQVSRWCADNVFDEDHAHGVRQLVTNPDLLAPIN